MDQMEKMADFIISKHNKAELRTVLSATEEDMELLESKACIQLNKE
jgi:hypothetical protein